MFCVVVFEAALAYIDYPQEDSHRDGALARLMCRCWTHEAMVVKTAHYGDAVKRWRFE